MSKFSINKSERGPFSPPSPTISARSSSPTNKFKPSSPTISARSLSPSNNSSYKRIADSSSISNEYIGKPYNLKLIPNKSTMNQQLIMNSNQLSKNVDIYEDFNNNKRIKMSDQSCEIKNFKNAQKAQAIISMIKELEAELEMLN